MKAQEILEGICRHRAEPIMGDDLQSLQRKSDQIEWALQALAEYLVEREPVE